MNLFNNFQLVNVDGNFKLINLMTTLECADMNCFEYMRLFIQYVAKKILA